MRMRLSLLWNEAGPLASLLLAALVVVLAKTAAAAARPMVEMMDGWDGMIRSPKGTISWVVTFWQVATVLISPGKDG